MRTYRQLFGVTEFRALFGTQCLTVAAASIGSLALGTITYSATHNALLSGLAMFGGPLIRLAASWFLLSASDLLRPRQALAAVAAIGCAADLLQAIPGMPWGLRFVILALPWIAMSAAGGSMLALVSDILPDASYVFGRATLNIAVGGMQIVAYALGGILLLYLDTPALFLWAAAASALAFVLVVRGVGDHPPRPRASQLVRRARTVNRTLLGSPLLRPVFLAALGAERPDRGVRVAVRAVRRTLGRLPVRRDRGRDAHRRHHGRPVPARAGPHLARRAAALPARRALRAVLPAPGAGAGRRARLPRLGGYAASLPLQERLISHTGAEVRGQVLGLNSTGVTAMQGVGAVLAGLLTQRLHGGPAAAATAIGVMGCASLAITVALIPGLRRTRPRRGRYGSGTAPAAVGGPASTPEDHRSSTLPSRQ